MSTASPTLIRTKWPELPESVVLDSGAVRNVTGWLKQVNIFSYLFACELCLCIVRKI